MYINCKTVCRFDWNIGVDRHLLNEVQLWITRLLNPAKTNNMQRLEQKCGEQEQSRELINQADKETKHKIWTGLDLKNFATESELKIRLCRQLEYLCIDLSSVICQIQGSNGRLLLNGVNLNANTAYFVWGRLERTALVTITMSKHLRNRVCNVPTTRALALVQWHRNHMVWPITRAVELVTDQFFDVVKVVILAVAAQKKVWGYTDVSKLHTYMRDFLRDSQVKFFCCCWFVEFCVWAHWQTHA